MGRVHQLIFVAAAALSAAGVALAQDHAGEGFYGNAPMDNYQFPDPGAWQRSAPLDTKHQREVRASAQEGYKLACAPDREMLCKDKDWRRNQLGCVNYYRLKVSPSCKSALTQLHLAQQGAL